MASSRSSSVLLFLALVYFSSVIIFSQARTIEEDLALTKEECETELLLAAQNARTLEDEALHIVNTAATKKKKKKKKKRSPPPSSKPTSNPSPRPSTATPSGGGGKITVSSGGSYSKVQDAIDAASAGATITINGGNYQEKVVIPSSKKGLKLIGVGSPRIYYSQSADQAGSTPKSASVSVFADGFYCSGVTFENTFGFPDGREDGQAVALLANGDNQVFDSCKFLGHQDTLAAWRGTQTFRRCFIQGSVDYIFGASRARFESCTMRTIGLGSKDYTSVAAHYRTSSSESTGFAFLGGSVSGYDRMWLGRLWGPYCRIIYSGTSIQNARSEGWTTMSSGGYTKTARVGGVNVGTSGWVDWALTGSEAAAELAKFA